MALPKQGLKLPGQLDVMAATVARRGHRATRTACLRPTVSPTVDSWLGQNCYEPSSSTVG